MARQASTRPITDAVLKRMHTHEIVGRDAELDEIGQVLATPAAYPTAVILEARAGMGKTTLWTAGVDTARARGYTVLACRANEAEANLSYAALADLFDPVLEAASETLPPVQRHALEVALLRAEPDHRRPDQRTVSAAALSMVRALATDTPVVLAIDDLHSLDASTAGVLRFVLRRLNDEPVLVLSCIRSGRVDPLEMSVSLDLPQIRILLEPLDIHAIEHILTQHLSTPPPLETIKAIWETGQGNPFFALAVGRGLAERGAPEPGTPLPVPDDVSSLLRDRIARLPKQDREVLLACSLLAQPTPAAIEAAVSDPGRTLERDDLADVIAVSDGEVRFAHPLFASAVYDAATQGERLDMHRRLTHVVADPEQRAWHLALSTPGPDEEIAATVAEGALRAHRRGATVGAAEFYELAGKLAQGCPSEWRYLMHAGDLHHLSGDSRRAMRLLEETVTSLPPGPQRAEVQLHLGRVAWFAEDWARVGQRLEKAITEPGADACVRSQLCALLADALFYEKGPASALPYAERALELAEESGDPGAIARAIPPLVDIRGAAGQRYDLALLERALVLEGSVEFDSMVECPALVLAGSSVTDYRTSRSILESLLQDARDRGDEPGVTIMEVNLGELEWIAGNWSRALDLLADADRLRTLAGMESRDRGLKALIEASLGDIEAANADAHGRRKPDPGSCHAAWVMESWASGFVALSLGDAAVASAHLTPLWRTQRQHGFGDPLWYPFLGDLIEALIELGRTDEAGAVLDWLEEPGRVREDRSRAIGNRYRALQSAAKGDLEGGRAGLEAALLDPALMEMPFEHGRTLLCAGIVQRRAGRRRDSRRSLEGALSAFERLPAPLWAAKAKDELARIGGRQKVPGLTEAEERVAHLAAEGRTNREIAAALFLSVRTVESHLSHAYRKLDVRSRTELPMVLREAPDQSSVVPQR